MPHQHHYLLCDVQASHLQVSVLLPVSSDPCQMSVPDHKPDQNTDKQQVIPSCIDELAATLFHNQLPANICADHFSDIPLHFLHSS